MTRNNLRQLTRSHEWWDHKTPQVLSLAYATALTLQVSLYELLYPAFAIIFVSLVCMAIYASIINDYTDMEIDIACGKSNMMQARSLPLRLLLLIAGSMLPISAIIYMHKDILSTLFYFGILVSISLYSFPPTRLKDKGIWGVISCAAAEHFFPTIFSVAVIFHASKMPLNFTWLIACGTLSFCYGLRSILWHQFLDRENDQQSGMHTFASRIDPEKFIAPPRWIISVELICLCFLLIYLNIMLCWLALAVYLLFIWRRRIQFKSVIIIVKSPPNQYFQILMLDFYTIFFPISLLTYHAATFAYGWIVLCLHLALFYKIIVTMCIESYHLGHALLKKLF
jgi:4-hydroxybenzoate polyprenyltransferase